MRLPVVGLGVALLLASFASAARADDTSEARLREALRQTAQQLHDAQAALEQQQLATAAAERERDALKSQAHPAAKEDTARTAALQRQLAASAQELAQARTDAQTAQGARTATEQALQRKETERAAAADQLAKLRERDARCAANDDAFYAAGREIAALYRDPAFLSEVRPHHFSPLGFDRVRQENRMRALEDRFEDEQAKQVACRNAALPAAKAAATAPAAVAPVPDGSTP